jgi:KDO2-lipid IV(A) lauroyltransferase
VLSNLRRRAPYLAYRAASTVARGLPAPLADVTARSAAVALTAAMRGRRRVLERHLRRTHGRDLRGWQLEVEVQRSFASYARYWLESFRLPGTSSEELDRHIVVDGMDHLRAAIDTGKGVIIALPHLGGWDYGGAWFASQGYEPTVVVEQFDPPELFQWFVDFREGLGVHVVPLGPQAAAGTLKVLRSGGILGLLCDRDITGTGVEVEFLGERTTLPSGPATLALRTGATILPTAVFFEGNDGHRGVIRPPIDTTRTGRFREDMTRVTQDLANELGSFIRQAPEQWHCFQPNWPSDLE